MSCKMMAIFRVLLLFSIASTVISAVRIPTPQYYQYGDIKQQRNAKRQSTSFIAVTGVRGAKAVDGSSPIRREIRDLEKSVNVWTLYLLGLDSMQAAKQEDPLSWYKIAGKRRPFQARRTDVLFMTD